MMAQRYAPEEVSGAVLATELATDLVVYHGHQITFVTGAPNYPVGRVYSGYRNSLATREKLDGVQVIRTWSYISHRKTFLRRILNYGTFSATAFWGGLLAERPDLIFSYSPPLPLGLSAWLLSRIWRIPWILRVEDLYPDAAVAAGVLRNKAAIKFFSKLERFIYRRADHISLISEGFRRNLLAKGVSPGKLSVTPVWADPDIVHPMSEENEFRRENGLNGKFVILYAGALGHTSALEDVVSAAELLKDVTEVCFVIVGEGIKKKSLMKYAADKRLDNVNFLSFQPRQRFAEMLSAADLSLVTLNRNSFSSSLPSKTFNIMASARPILAVTPPESEIAQLVSEGNCGINVPPSEPSKLAQTILQLKEDVSCLKEMGDNGRKLLESRFSRRECTASFANLFEHILR